MNNLKFRYVYQHKEDFKIADTTDSIWTLEQIAEGEPNNYIDVCLSSSWKVIGINQYTGLKDKNGKEIFEGDILRIEEKNVFVYYNDDGLYELGGAKTLLKGLAMNKRVGTPLEIIGNIYENPELLNK